jgi:tetratricopeptide (TPR) repeat protein
MHMRSGCDPDSSDSRCARKGTRWRWLALVSLVVVAAAGFVWVRWPVLRERWLVAQSLQTLKLQSEQDERDTLAHLVYARRCVSQGLYSAAALAASRALASVSRATTAELRGRVYAMAGYASARQGDVDLATDYLARAESLRTDDPLLPLTRGTLALRQHHLVDAAHAFEIAARKAPDLLPAWSGLGDARLLGAEPQLAIDAFRRVVALAPNNPQGHSMLAEGFAANKQFSEAISERKAARDLAPGDQKYSNLLAIILATEARNEAEYGDARARLERLLADDPQNPRLHATLGGLHIRFGRYDLARSEMEASLAISPEVASEWQALALALDRAGDKRGSDLAQQRAYTLFDAEVDAARRKMMTPRSGTAKSIGAGTISPP